MFKNNKPEIGPCSVLQHQKKLSQSHSRTPSQHAFFTPSWPLNLQFPDASTQYTMVLLSYQIFLLFYNSF